MFLCQGLGIKGSYAATKAQLVQAMMNCDDENGEIQETWDHIVEEGKSAKRGSTGQVSEHS